MTLSWSINSRDFICNFLRLEAEVTKNPIWRMEIKVTSTNMKIRVNFQEDQKFSFFLFPCALPVSFGNLRRTWESPKKSCSLLISSSWIKYWRNVMDWNEPLVGLCVLLYQAKGRNHPRSKSKQSGQKWGCACHFLKFHFWALLSIFHSSSRRNFSFYKYQQKRYSPCHTNLEVHHYVYFLF